MFLAITLASLSLEPTSITFSQTCGGNWKLAAPATTKPNTPRFDFSMSSESLLPSSQLYPMVWHIHGSLGLPFHPLGLFKINASGPACGEQTALIMDGVLGQVLLSFPQCPWAATSPGLSVNAHVDVWTVLPAIPPVVSTGFQLNMSLLPSGGGEPLLCTQMDIVQPPQSGADPEQDTCGLDNTDKVPFPPGPEAQIPTVTVDLDAPAEIRWAHVVKPRTQGIKRLIASFLEGQFGISANTTTAKVIELLLSGAAIKEMHRMPADFAAEMEGIAIVTGIPLGEIWVLNMMYELTGYCTSIVAQDSRGTIWHGRNLDFGLFMGTNATTHTWGLVDPLQDILVNVQYMRGGKLLFNATTYAGFVGVHSGFKAGSFSITVDTRYDSHLDAGIIGWLLGKNNGGQFLCFQTRMILEANISYTEAFQSLTTYKPLGPAYIILGGTQPGEGAVVAKTFNSSAEKAGVSWDPNYDVWPLSESLQAGSFYVIETNYDRVAPPPSFDDRRYPAVDCLDKMGPNQLNVNSLWSIMTANPTRNGLTTFTMLMSAGLGHFETYKTQCTPGPHCVPF